MFFAAPDAAFANLHQALRPGGRLGFVCWQQLPDNPWMFVPFMAAAPHLTLPPPPAPDAPGPFAFADQDRVRGILERAGFADVAFEDHRATLTVGGDGSLDRAVDFLLQGVGPTSAAMRQADPAVACDGERGGARRAAAVSHAARVAHGICGMAGHRAAALKPRRTDVRKSPFTDPRRGATLSRMGSRPRRTQASLPATAGGRGRKSATAVDSRRRVWGPPCATVGRKEVIQ